MTAKSKQANRRSSRLFIEAAVKVTKATTRDEFFDALRSGYLALHSRLTQDADGGHADALREAFNEVHGSPGVRMALEMCAMPIYEKPVIPGEPTEAPEFLWLFTLPVVIRFPAEICSEGAFVWEADPLPAEALLEALKTSNRFSDRADLRMFTNLYTRSDLLAWGPENLAMHALNCEISDADCPVPLPVYFAAELLGYRSVMFLALCAARVPVGVKSLIRPRETESDLVEMGELIASNLKMLNIPFESITVAPPCPVTSSCFVSNPAFLRQAHDICEASKKVWDLKAVFVKFPLPGYVEIAGKLESGAEVILMPAALCCEPRTCISASLEQVIRLTGLPLAQAQTAITVSPDARVH